MNIWVYNGFERIQFIDDITFPIDRDNDTHLNKISIYQNGQTSGSFTIESERVHWNLCK